MMALIGGLASSILKNKMSQNQAARNKPIGGDPDQLQGADLNLNYMGQPQQQAQQQHAMGIGTNFLQQILEHHLGQQHQQTQPMQNQQPQPMQSQGYMPMVPNSPEYGQGAQNNSDGGMTNDWLSHILSNHYGGAY